LIARLPPVSLFWLPALFSVLLHAALLFLLTLNWTGKTDAAVKPRTMPRFVEAKLVTLQVAPKKEKQPTRKPAASAPKPRPATARPAPAAPRPTPKPVEKPRAEPKPEPKAEAPAPRRPSAEERAAAAREELALAMAAEDELLEAATDEQLTASYVALIARAVEDNWSRPPSARNDMEAELVLQLIPTGEVVSVTLAVSSGNTAFDRSAVQAVQKAEKFPELQQLESHLFEQNFRRLRLKFKPEDLRY